jgi:hypothetical protein
MSLRGLASDEYSDFKRGFVSQSVIPTWVEQCGPDCAELFNATIAQVVGVKAGTFAGPTPTPTRQPTPTPTRPPTATPTPSPTPAPVPNVLFVGAEFVTADAHGQRITVPVGSIVQVYVTLESSAATEGQLEVHIVKDITLATDETKRLCGSKVSLEAGLNEVMACDFVADQLSSGSLRHYFLKVQWNGDFIHDPLDPETREALVTVVAPIVTPTVAAVTQWYVLASQIITLPPLNVLDMIASKLTLEPGEELVGTPFVLIAGKENCLITADQDSSLNVAVFDVSTGEITVQTFFVILGGDQTVCFIKSTTADSEFAAIQTAVSSMMSDNSIAALPNPSALTAGNGTGGCDTGTTLMTAFPDATSVIAVDKILDPNGGTYVEGVDPLGDKAGFLLFSHDLVAGDDQVSLVNYMSVGTTAFCYQTTADGIITQFDTDGHQTNP